MKLVIAEKPSVAHSIADVIGAKNKKDGYVEGNDYVVSWCIGHLVGLAQPDSYGEEYKSWNNLPIVPEKWNYEIKENTKKQFNTLRELMKRDDIDEVICATDAGREGELIFRHTYKLSGCKKPFKRLWISSLENKAIAEGFENLKNGSDYDDLYKSALCRERADWLVGMNATRLFTTRYNADKVLSIGRVQSPTLAMIVARDMEIKNFKKEKYYTVVADFDTFKAESEKIADYNQAQAVVDKCNGSTATVTEVKKEIKKVNAPKLYDLTSLQRDANRVFGLTANQTLEAVQALYDSKLATYPRTDSQYLTEDMEETAGKMIGVIKEVFPELAENTADEYNIKPVLNNKKVSDHHAIIPTENIKSCNLNELSQINRNVLLLIAHRLLSATSKSFEYEATNVIITCADTIFKANGRTVLNDGFRKIEENFKTAVKSSVSKEQEEAGKSNSTLPIIKEGEQFSGKYSTAEHYTTPPKPYTEDTLLSAMERAGNNDYDTDEVERKGLGTPATRASIIETIINRGYVVRNKKQLLPTEKGIAVVSILPEPLKSAKMTAEWENKLVLVSKGEYSAKEFMDNIKDFVVDIVQNTEINNEKQALFSEREVIGSCPRCNGKIYEGKLNFYCENEDCSFALWKKNKFWETKKKEITKTAAKALLSKGKVRVKDLYSEKTGKTYEADILLDDTGGKYVNFKMEFPEKKK